MEGYGYGLCSLKLYFYLLDLHFLVFIETPPPLDIELCTATSILVLHHILSFVQQQVFLYYIIFYLLSGCIYCSLESSCTRKNGRLESPN